MNYAIIFIKNDEEKQLSKAPFKGGNLLSHAVHELKKINVDKIYVVGSDEVFLGTVSKNTLNEAIEEIGNTGKCLLVSPLYPAVEKEEYLKLLEVENTGAAISSEGEVCEVFMVPCSQLNELKEVEYQLVSVTDKKVTRFTSNDVLKADEDKLNDIAVFSLTSNVELVDEVCAYLGINRGKTSVAHFADGETLVELGESVRGKNIFIIQSTCKPVNEKLMELLICIDAAKRSSAKEISVVIPYYGYARQDRKASPRQPITAKLVATMLEQAGADRVIAFDLHAQQIQGFFSCPVDDLTTVPMIGRYFANKGFNLDELCVVSPDHGGVKRARNLAEILKVPMAIIDKRRPRANVCEAMNVIGDVKGKNVIVVDDICDTGGSLIAACNILKENGAKDVYVAITHGIFSNNALQRLQDSNIKELVVTNTIPLTAEELNKTTKLTVLSIAWMLSKLITAITCHTPVSEVYALYDEVE